jgi:hypothetical protein
MSLLVNVFIRDQEHQVVVLEEESPGSELAGLEVCRRTLYGGKIAQSFGLVLLPTLRGQDLYAEGVAVDLLAQEATLILQHIALFAQESGFEPAYIQQRIENIIQATEKAKTVSGGVLIW